MSRPRGPILPAFSARSAGGLLRQLEHFGAATRTELTRRHFFLGATGGDDFLVQTDATGLSFYSPFVNTAGGTWRWRKIADLDNAGNLRIRGAITTVVAFAANEDL